jgi:hypothetical protein
MSRKGTSASSQFNTLCECRREERQRTRVQPPAAQTRKDDGFGEYEQHNLHKLEDGKSCAYLQHQIARASGAMQSRQPHAACSHVQHEHTCANDEIPYECAQRTVQLGHVRQVENGAGDQGTDVVG